MRLASLVLAIFCLAAMSLATAQTIDAKSPTLDDFLEESTFWGPELSPSGRYLSGVRRVDEDTYLMMVDLDDLEAEPIYQPMGDYRLNWVEWISDDRLLLSTSGLVDLNSGKPLRWEELPDLGRLQYPVVFDRIYSITRDGRSQVVLFGDDGRMKKNFNLGRVVDFLPNDPDHILMAANRSGDLDLFRVSVIDGSFERIATGNRNTYRWMTDRDGEPAFRFNINSRGTIMQIFAREDRKNGTIKWRKIHSIRLRQTEYRNAAIEFELLFPGPTSTTYYVAARPEGEDKTAIYLYDFESDSYLEKVKDHAEFDMHGALFNWETYELTGFMHYDHRLVIELIDPGKQAHLNGLNAFFDHELNVQLMDSSADESRWLVKVSGPNDPGSYYLYDSEAAHIEYLASNTTRFAGKALGKTQIVEFEARDGLPLFGYLTRPPNARASDRPPLIVMPHGGPVWRDTIGFDERVQILVAAGYQVLQPHFRGSSGFGKGFEELGHRQWGKAMQTDVEDAFAHVVSEGFADADRACILGASYGGYVALVAATLTPDLYQCAIAIAAPSDLIRMLRWTASEYGYNSDIFDLWVERMGHPRDDRDALIGISPARLAESVTRPLMLVHGKDDFVVPVEQMEIMADALEDAGKPFEKLLLEDSGHSISSRSDKDQRTEHERILTFLGTHLQVIAASEESEVAQVDRSAAPN